MTFCILTGAGPQPDAGLAPVCLLEDVMHQRVKVPDPRPFISHPRSQLARFALSVLTVLLVLGNTTKAETDHQIGPGVAGQLHAVAFDPRDSDRATIYVGGDNFGVYRTTDLGENWEPWNKGMENANPKRTSYVDDIVVVRPEPGNPDLVPGVYAATFGGIIYRPDGGIWQHQTMNLTYDDDHSLMEDHGGAIPFSTLAYDSQTKILYAGAGRARYPDYDHYSPYYPLEDEATHSSLWRKDLDRPTSVWAPVTDIGGVGESNVGNVWQVAIVNEGTPESRLVVAAGNGVYIQGVGRNGWVQIWDSDAGPAQNWPGFSTRAWSVAAGGAGRIYVITHRDEYDAYPSLKYADPDQDGIYPTTFDGWYDLDPGQSVPPWDAGTWTGIMNSADLYTLTVIPAADPADDQVFVGMISDRTAEYCGYFRYGRYRLASGAEDVGWVNFITRDSHNGVAGLEYDFYYVDYLTDAYDKKPLDSGWLVQFPLLSTVPLAFHPDDPNLMFAAGFHIPLIAEDVEDPTKLWKQSFCSSSDGEYYNLSGLEEMSPRAIGFTEPADGGPGKLVIGCGDFQAFLSSDETGSSFKDMDPLYTGKSMGLKVETIGEEIYVLRGAAGQWGSPFEHFGYQGRLDQYGNPNWLSRQDHVIARYNPNLAGMGVGDDGYHWEFVSRGLDTFTDIPASPAVYDIVDFEVADESTMFAAVRWWTGATDNKIWHSLVARGTRTGMGTDWSWESWWTPPSYTFDGLTDDRSRMVTLEIVPGTDIILVADKIHPNAVTALDMTLSAGQVGAAWMDRIAVDQYLLGLGFSRTHRLYGATRNITAMACDRSGQWLYLANKGSDLRGDDSHYCANVSRVQIPEDGSAPAVEDWELILNTQVGSVTSEGITFEAASQDYYPDGWDESSVGVAESLPNIKNIAIHPDNPTRVFVGIRAVTPAVDESYHPQNGLYENDPNNGGQWRKVSPPIGGFRDPCHGVHVLSFVPSDPGQMIVGVYGQGFFRVEGIAACPVPLVSPQALQALYPGQNELQLEIASASGAPLEDLSIDGSSIGLGDSLDLTDADGDGIWTADLTGHTAQVGQVLLPVFARDENWNTVEGEISVAVLTGPPAGSPPFLAEDDAQEAVHDGQRLLMIAAEAAGDASVEFVTVMLAAPWQPQVIELNDAGPGEGLDGADWQAGDGIWTGVIDGDLPPVGLYSVDVRIGDSVHVQADDVAQVEVIDVPGVYFKNGSAKTTLSEAGMPTGVAPIDLVPQGESGTDYGRDLYIGRFDDPNSSIAEGGLMAVQQERTDEVPQFVNRAAPRFGPLNIPEPGHGPATSADLDNDGLMDLIIPSGSSSEGLLIYRQTTTGSFELTDWADEIADTDESWAAACADYDGDGFIDVYLCRAHVSAAGSLPVRNGCSGLPDVLLKNDLYDSGKFIDASAEFEVVLKDGSPKHLASRTAAWGDFDDDGDPDLAVADADEGEGFFLFENRGETRGSRFELYYEPTGFNVSDLIWMDRDGNGDLELLVTTFDDGDVAGQAYFYNHDTVVPSGPFVPSLPMSAPPPHASSGARVADVNLDGHLDFMLLPQEQGTTPILALNSGDGGSFGVPSDSAGLATFTGATNGGVLSDFNGDGAPEVFLGRTQTDFRFLGMAEGPDIGEDWVGLRLICVNEGREVPAVGAKVVVQTGHAEHGDVGMIVSADGRSDHVLKIGIAEGSSPTCTIVWPNGAVEVDKPLADAVNAEQTYQQPLAFEIDASTVQGYQELLPNGQTDLVFRWRTSTQTDIRTDQVTITGGSVNPPVSVLALGVEDVTVKHWRDCRHGNVLWWHEIRLCDQPCEPGYMDFSVESSSGLETREVTDQQIDFPLCTTNPDPINQSGGGGL